jgi:glucan phosphoethanolaminetransferase (alkaline phosphatase superfamily)
MKQATSQKTRKNWIVTHYSFVILILASYYLSKQLQQPLLFFIIGSLAFILAATTFYFSFGKTGLWNMVHSKNHRLDERQTLVVLNAMKYSYSIFSIGIIAIMYIFSLFFSGQISPLLIASLLYLAHTLPAAYLGWTEQYL